MRSSILSSVPCRWVTRLRLGPKPESGLVHGRQVMKVNHVRVAEACALEHALPRGT